MYAETHNKVNYSGYTPSTIALCDRKVFEDGVKQERELFELQVINKRTEHADLRPWQEQLLKIIKEEDSNRTVFWIYDNKGGTGKSFMCQYMLKSGAILFPDFNYRDNCYLYNNERMVVFDLARSSTSPSDLWRISKMDTSYPQSMRLRRKYLNPLLLSSSVMNYPRKNS